MNFNRSELIFKALSEYLADTTRQAKITADLTPRRLANVQQAIGHQLQLIPMQLTLNALGQVQSYNVRTKPLDYDLIVCGYMSDGQNRDIILQKADGLKPLVFVGDASNLFLTFTDISGQPQNVNPKGQKGIFNLPNPKLFLKGDRISLDVYKREDTADPQVINFVVIAYRVIDKRIADVNYAKDLPIISEYIGKRFTPETLFLKTDITFSTADITGVAQVFTPQLEEPCIIRGIRTSLNNARFEASLQGYPPITVDKTPLWAFAHGDEIEFENYLWQRRGIYVPKNTQMQIDLYNDGESLDLQGTDGENFITFCIDTV